jgi:hypothetical protein
VRWRSLPARDRGDRSESEPGIRVGDGSAMGDEEPYVYWVGCSSSLLVETDSKMEGSLVGRRRDVEQRLYVPS